MSGLKQPLHVGKGQAGFLEKDDVRSGCSQQGMVEGRVGGGVVETVSTRRFIFDQVEEARYGV